MKKNMRDIDRLIDNNLINIKIRKKRGHYGQEIDRRRGKKRSEKGL